LEKVVGFRLLKSLNFKAINVVNLYQPFCKMSAAS